MSVHKHYLEKIDQCIFEGKYKADWDTMRERKMPQWMQKGKFGIFIHWGVYSVPAFGNEWYSRNMYIQGSPEFHHHIENWGNHEHFGYKDFVPLFNAENFVASEWANLFYKAGAKYVIPVAEHHDGFQMYASNISEWNAKKMGPKRDILFELKEACLQEGLSMGLSNHRVEHWFFMSHGREFPSDIKEPMQRGDFYWPAMKEPDHYDLFSEPFPTEEFLEDWLVRCCELVDQYQPKQFYFDWWIQHSSVKPYLKKFAAYYYNQADKWGEEVTICYKHDAFPMGTATIDIERGKFSSVQPFHWQTDTAIAKNSWSWTENNQFKSSSSLVADLIDIVSKNGVLLLNIGPKADGTISEQEKTILLEIGEWLSRNGDGIYETIPWRVSEEGPTKTVEGQFTDGNETTYTSKDFRFTCKGKDIYAHCLRWPELGKVTITSLGIQDGSKLPVFCGVIRKVVVLNHCNTSWRRNTEGLHVEGDSIKTKMPVVIKITVD